MILTPIPETPPAKLAKIKTEIDYCGFQRTKGAYWKGVQHAVLIDHLRKAVWNSTGYDPEPAHTWTTRRGGNVYACFRVIATSRHDLWLGVEASNVGRAQLTVYCGAVQVGDGTRVITDGFVGAKYATDFDLEAECRTLAAGWHAASKTISLTLAAMKLRTLTTADIDRAVMEASRTGTLLTERIPAVVAKLGELEVTAMDLAGAFSAGMVRNSQRSLESQMRDLLGFHRILTTNTERGAA